MKKIVAGMGIIVFALLVFFAVGDEKSLMKQVIRSWEAHRRKNISTKREKAFLKEEVPFKSSRTQSEAFLSRANASWLVSLYRWFYADRELDRFVIETVLPREKEFIDTHFVLYHGTTRSMWVYYQFRKALHKALYGVELNNFLYLRSFRDFYRLPETIKHFYETFYDRSDYSFGFDHIEPIKSYLLSTNVSFPDYQSDGESTFEYYKANQSVSGKNVTLLFCELFQHYKLLESREGRNAVLWALYELQKVVDLIFRHWAADYGLLLSIFVPKEIIDQVAVITEPFGKLLANRVPISMFLDKFINTNDKTIYGKEQFNLQARLLLTSSFFADPDSGIKIFMDHGIDPIDESKAIFMIHKIAQEIAQQIMGLSSSIPEDYILPNDKDGSSVLRGIKQFFNEWRDTCRGTLPSRKHIESRQQIGDDSFRCGRPWEDISEFYKEVGFQKYKRKKTEL